MNVKTMAGVLAGTAAAVALLAGCTYSPTDSDVRSEFYDQIEFLNRPAETADPGTRYRFAHEFFERVDFESIEDAQLLKTLIGKPTKVSGQGNSQIWEYEFVSPRDGNPIHATFRVEGNRVASAKVVCPPLYKK